MTHYKNVHTHLAVTEQAARGVTVRRGQHWGVQLALHNGCGRNGNMLTTLDAGAAIDIALELLALGRELQKQEQQAEKAKALLRGQLFPNGVPPLPLPPAPPA